MKFYSTNDATHLVGVEEAIFRGLPADNGLYMPERIDPLPDAFFFRPPYPFVSGNRISGGSAIVGR